MPTVKEALAERALTAAEQVEWMLARLRELAEQAVAVRHGAALLAAVRELRPTAELLAKLTGELKPSGGVVNVQINAMLVQVNALLERHPGLTLDTVTQAVDTWQRIGGMDEEQIGDMAARYLAGLFERKPALRTRLLAVVGAEDDAVATCTGA